MKETLVGAGCWLEPHCCGASWVQHQEQQPALSLSGRHEGVSGVPKRARCGVWGQARLTTVSTPTWC
mgnify:CR=1 FL=1